MEDVTLVKIETSMARIGAIYEDVGSHKLIRANEQV